MFALEMQQITQAAVQNLIALTIIRPKSYMITHRRHTLSFLLHHNLWNHLIHSSMSLVQMNKVKMHSVALEDGIIKRKVIIFSIWGLPFRSIAVDLASMLKKCGLIAYQPLVEMSLYSGDSIAWRGIDSISLEPAHHIQRIGSHLKSLLYGHNITTAVRRHLEPLVDHIRPARELKHYVKSMVKASKHGLKHNSLVPNLELLDTQFDDELGPHNLMQLDKLLFQDENDSPSEMLGQCYNPHNSFSLEFNDTGDCHTVDATEDNVTIHVGSQDLGSYMSKTFRLSIGPSDNPAKYQTSLHLRFYVLDVSDGKLNGTVLFAEQEKHFASSRYCISKILWQSTTSKVDQPL